MKAARHKSPAPSWTPPRSYTSRACKTNFSRKDAKITAKNAKKEQNENSIARASSMRLIGCIRLWGPGLLESVYEAALAYELEKRGLNVGRQQSRSRGITEEVHIHTAFYAKTSWWKTW